MNKICPHLCGYRYHNLTYWRKIHLPVGEVSLAHRTVQSKFDLHPVEKLNHLQRKNNQWNTDSQSLSPHLLHKTVTADISFNIKWSTRWSQKSSTPINGGCLNFKLLEGHGSLHLQPLETDIYSICVCFTPTDTYNATTDQNRLFFSFLNFHQVKHYDSYLFGIQGRVF